MSCLPPPVPPPVASPPPNLLTVASTRSRSVSAPPCESTQTGRPDVSPEPPTSARRSQRPSRIVSRPRILVSSASHPTPFPHLPLSALLHPHPLARPAPPKPNAPQSAHGAPITPTHDACHDFCEPSNTHARDESTRAAHPRPTSAVRVVPIDAHLSGRSAGRAPASGARGREGIVRLGRRSQSVRSDGKRPKSFSGSLEARRCIAASRACWRRNDWRGSTRRRARKAPPPPHRPRCSLPCSLVDSQQFQTHPRNLSELRADVRLSILAALVATEVERVEMLRARRRPGGRTGVAGLRTSEAEDGRKRGREGGRGDAGRRGSRGSHARARDSPKVRVVARKVCR